MNSEVEISLRIEKIRHIFQAAQAFAEAVDDQYKIVAYCNNKEPEFRSVAFEAAAMTLAARDIAEGPGLTRWTQFASGPAKAHTSQAHAALGWALAQQRITDLSLLDGFDPMLLSRVMDGHGYYDGIFRQRRSVGNQEIPDHISDQLLKGYDQGVGRSLWYSSRGSIEKLLSSLAAFPPYRHQDLWRGVGVASAYVGGCNEDDLYDLAASAGICRSQLAIGALFVASARHTAQAPTPDADLACQVWCHCSAQEAAQILQNLSHTNTFTSPISYPDWLQELEAQLPTNQHASNL